MWKLTEDEMNLFIGMDNFIEDEIILTSYVTDVYSKKRKCTEKKCIYTEQSIPNPSSRKKKSSLKQKSIKEQFIIKKKSNQKKTIQNTKPRRKKTQLSLEQNRQYARNYRARLIRESLFFETKLKLLNQTNKNLNKERNDLVIQVNKLLKCVKNKK